MSWNFILFDDDEDDTCRETTITFAEVLGENRIPKIFDVTLGHESKNFMRHSLKYAAMAAISSHSIFWKTVNRKITQ